MKRDLKYATITLKDAGANTLDLKIGEGAVQWTTKKNIEYVLDRGHLDGVREGDEVPVDISIECVYEYVTATSGGTETVDDVLNHDGEAAEWVTTSADPCEPFALDLLIVYQVTNCPTIEKETITFAEFRVDSIQHDEKTGMLSITGRANVTKPTAVRAAQGT